MLASLVDSHNNILVPGFYANVRPNMLQVSCGAHASHETMGGGLALLQGRAWLRAG